MVLLRFAHQVHLRHMNYKTAKEEAEDRIHKYTNTQIHKYTNINLSPGIWLTRSPRRRLRIEQRRLSKR